MTPKLYIYKKDVDWSALHLGLNIPVALQDVFYENMKLKLRKGESKKVKLLIESNEYLVTLTNISFDERHTQSIADHQMIIGNPNYYNLDIFVVYNFNNL